MEKIIRLAIANMRKNKGQSASFFFITLFAAVLLNVGLIIALDYPQNFDKKAEELQAPDAVFTAQTNSAPILQQFEETLRKDKETLDVKIQPILIAQGDFTLAGGKMSRMAAFFSKDAEADTNDWSIVEEAKESNEDSIYLPWLFSQGANYEIGDSFSLTISATGTEKKKMIYQVAGFYEDIYYSTINSGTTGFLLTKEGYQKLLAQYEGALSGTRFLVDLRERTEEGYCGKYLPVLNKMIGENKMSDSNYYKIMKSARTVTASIGSLIIISFSVIIMIVSLVVVKFRISNSIEEEMQNIGTLRAIGYTGAQIMASFLMQFLLLAAAGTLFSIAASSSLLPLISIMFASQTGLIWEQQFSISAMILTIAGIGLSVVIVALLSSRRVRRLLPIEALRAGVASHNFKRNPLPLESSRAGLHITMAGKQFFTNIRQNFIISIIMTGVTFTGIFAAVMFYNGCVESDIFARIMLGQVESVRFSTATEEAAEDLAEELRQRDEVEEVSYLYTNTLDCQGEKQIYSYIANNFSGNGNPDWLYQGRFPRHENEVAVGGLLAKKMGKQIGDTIAFSVDEKDGEYLITGLIQSAYYLGQDVCMTGEGYQKLQEDFKFRNVSVRLRKGTDTGAFIKKVEKERDDIAGAVNQEGNTKATMSVYKTIIGIISVIIGIISLCIIGLVLYLVLKTLLIRQKRELAVKKAIGYTTVQLAIQNAGAFFPVIFFGTLLGGIIGYFKLNAFLSILFSSIGLMRVNFTIPLMLVLPVFASILLCGSVISFLVSMGVKKVSPYSLLIE